LAQFLIYLKSLKRAVDVKPNWTLTETQVRLKKLNYKLCCILKDSIRTIGCQY